MKPNDLDRCSNALFFVRRRFSWMFPDLRMLLEEQSSTSESKMAAGAAAVRMLQTVSSFRHKDASRGPAYFHGVTSLAHSAFEPRKNKPLKRAGFMTARLLTVSLCFTLG